MEEKGNEIVRRARSKVVIAVENSTIAMEGEQLRMSGRTLTHYLTNWAFTSFIIFLLEKDPWGSLFSSLGWGLIITILLEVLYESILESSEGILSDPERHGKLAALKGRKPISLAPLKESNHLIDSLYESLQLSSEKYQYHSREQLVDVLATELVKELKTYSILESVVVGSGVEK